MMGQQLLIFNPSGILKHGIEVKGKKKKGQYNTAHRQLPADLILRGKAQASFPACANVFVCL